jgi:hypothetical protein
MEATATNRFEKPHQVTALDVALCGNVDRLLPPMSEIPDEFKRTHGKWVDVVSTWFFCGLRNAKWTPKAGINTGEALAHVKACMGSFAPAHEHKEAGCAYLLSLWFEDVKYERDK